MARLIDGDALIAWIKGGQQMTSKMKSIICYIKTMPTIDAAEVVRCKDCVFGELDNRAEMYRCRSVSFPHWNKGEHFCSYGERETDHE